MKLITSFKAPIKTVSEANQIGHWITRHSRHKKQKKAIEQYLILHQISGFYQRYSKPILIKLTRISPRMLDDEDNLPMAFKAIKDYIANYLHPGLQMGRADGLEIFKWHYAQEKGAVREYAIRVEFWELTKEDRAPLGLR